MLEPVANTYQDFVDTGKMITNNLLSLGYRWVKLVSTVKKFYGRHPDLVYQYNWLSVNLYQIWCFSRDVVRFWNTRLSFSQIHRYSGGIIIGKKCLPTADTWSDLCFGIQACLSNISESWMFNDLRVRSHYSVLWPLGFTRTLRKSDLMASFPKGVW